jgi:hypothetical protein
MGDSWGENRKKSLSFDQLLENTRLEVFVQPIFQRTTERFPAGGMGSFCGTMNQRGFSGLGFRKRE